MAGWWKLSSRVCWAYRKGGWVLVRVRPCAVAGCRYEAYGGEAHCIRHWPRPAVKHQQSSLW